nr:26S proteasome non-ATPase regulatory subunit 12A-like protein [Cryptomonas curvata]
MITKNSKFEIINLKNKIFEKTNIDFLFKKISNVYKKRSEEKFEKFLQKNIYDFLENYLENWLFMFFSKLVIHYVFFPKIHIQYVSLILNQIIEFYTKNIFISYLEDNLNLMFKITEGKIDNQTISLKITSFLHLIRNSKGKLNNLAKKKNTRKTQLFSDAFSYEDLQMYIENIRIKLDCKKIESSGIIINQFFATRCILSNYVKIRLCFYQQIIKLFHFTQNLKLIIILYFSITIDFFKNRAQITEYPKEIFILSMYMTFLEKFEKNFRFYFRIILLFGKKFNKSIIYLMKNLLNSNLEWSFFKNFIFPNIIFLPIFLNNPTYNILKHMRAVYIKNNLLIASTQYSSLNIDYYSLLLDIDFKDTEHWLHELINSKKIVAKIDRSLGKVFFLF